MGDLGVPCAAARSESAGKRARRNNCRNTRCGAGPHGPVTLPLRATAQERAARRAQVHSGSTPGTHLVWSRKMGPKWRMHCVQTHDPAQSCHCSRPTRTSQKRASRQTAPSTHLCVCARAPDDRRPSPTASFREANNCPRRYLGTLPHAASDLEVDISTFCIVSSAAAFLASTICVSRTPYPGSHVINRQESRYVHR